MVKDGQEHAPSSLDGTSPLLHIAHRDTEAPGHCLRRLQLVPESYKLIFIACCCLHSSPVRYATRAGFCRRTASNPVAKRRTVRSVSPRLSSWSMACEIS